MSALAAILVVTFAGCNCGGEGIENTGGHAGAGGENTFGSGGDPQNDLDTHRGRGGPNRAPTIWSKPPLTATEGEGYRYQPRVDDLDGDLLTFTLVEAPTGMKISESTGAIYWRPGFMAQGMAPVKLHAADESGASADQAWIIDVADVNATPKITSKVPNTVASAGSTWTYAAKAADPDGDIPVFSIDPPVSGVSVDASTGVVQWVAAPTPVLVTLRASDPKGAFDAQTFRLVTPSPSDNAPPVVLLASPAQDSTIAGEVTLFGSVLDDTLARYTVSACPEKGDCKLIVTSSVPVDQGTLATLDAGTLDPGEWTLKIEATDAWNAKTTVLRNVNVVVGKQGGGIRLGFVDLVVQDGVTDLQIGRLYNGFDLTPGEFGNGWKLATNQLSALDPGTEPNVVLPSPPLSTGWEVFGDPISGGFVDGGPRVLDFTLPDGRKYSLIFDLEVSGFIGGGAVLNQVWIGDPGTSGQLLDDSENAYGDLLYVNGDPTLYRWEDGVSPFDPKHHELITEFGEVYRFDAMGKLESWIDENGVPHVWGGAGGIDALVNIEKDGAGHITKITDKQYGDAVVYSYTAGQLTGVLYDGGDFDGETQSFVYDADGRMTGYDAPGAAFPQIEYDEKGRIVRRTDGSGGVTELRYDKDDRITVIAPSGAEVKYELDAKGSITAFTDPIGAKWTNTYDNDGKVTGRADPLGRTTMTMAYDTNGNITTLSDPFGTRTATYDPKGYISGFTDGENASYATTVSGDTLSLVGPNGMAIETLTYKDGRLTKRDAAGVESSTQYDDKARPVLEVTANGTFQTQYDARGLVATVTNMETGETRVGRRDVSGNLREVTLSGGEKIKYDYDVRGNLRQVVGPDGSVQRFYFDGAGRQTRVEINGEITRRARYDADGNLVQTTDELGNVARMDRDPVGRVSALHTAAGVEKMEYDAAGKVTARMTPDGARTDFVYSAKGVLSQIKTEAGAELAIEHDKAGRPTKVIDGLGRSVEAQYDGYNQMTQIKLPGRGPEKFEYDYRPWDPTGGEDALPITKWTTSSGDVWKYEYSTPGRLTAIVDPLNHRTEYDVDVSGAVTKIRLAADRVWSIDLDTDGAVASVSRPSGATTTFSSDPDGTLYTVAPDGTTLEKHHSFDVTTMSGEGIGEERVERDAHGLVTLAKNAVANVVYERDGAGRLLSVSDGQATASYRYDGAGRLTRIRIESPSGTSYVTHYAYDPVTGRLSEVKDPTGGETLYAYDEAGHLTRVDRPNGTATTFEHEGTDRPSAIDQIGPSGQVLSHTRFAYDEGGRVAEIEGPSGFYKYSYTARDQLAREEKVGGAAIDLKWDDFGNLIERKVSGSATALTYDKDDVLTGVGGAAVTADGRGNRLTDTGEDGEARAFTYDVRDRVRTVARGGSTRRYDYDAEGNLVSFDSALGERHCLVGPSPSGMPVCLLEYGEGGDRAHVFDGQGILSQHGATVTRYAHAGFMGSIVALSDKKGAVEETLDYDAWGALREGSLPDDFAYGYIGERMTEAGLVYLRARWYDPGTARFLSMDHAPGAERDPRSLHRYRYVPEGAALNLRDPSGLQTAVETMSVSSIGQQMQNLKTAAMECVRSKALDAINDAAWSFATSLLTNLLFKGVGALVEAAFAGAWKGVSADDIGKRLLPQLLGNELCANIDFISNLPIGSTTGNIRFEVPCDTCGEEPVGQLVNNQPILAAFPCSGLLSIPARLTAPPGGTHIDIDLGGFPIEVKFGNKIGSKDEVFGQIGLYCRFAHRKKSYLAMLFTLDWPPLGDGGLTEKGNLYKMIEICAFAWKAPYTAQCKTPKGDMGPTSNTFGAVLLIGGYDRNDASQRIKVVAPNPKTITGLCSLAKGLSKAK